MSFPPRSILAICASCGWAAGHWAWVLMGLVGLAARIQGADGLDWQPGTGYRWAALPTPASGRLVFARLPAEATGVRFTNHLAETTSALNRILENGSGLALGDVDGDGWCDLYLCRLEGDNVLYRNLGGWRFEDVTARAGVACPDQYSTGAVFADVDGDRDLDLLVNAIGGGTRAFLNDGQGRFDEQLGTRLVRRLGSTSLALADMDGDGDLDLYVTNYRVDTFVDRPPGVKVEAAQVDGKIVVTPADRFIPVAVRSGGVEVIEKGERDFLYLNDGQGRFAPVSWTGGSFLDEGGRPLEAPPADWGLSVMFRDLNGDGAPDLYVCNDFFYFPDRIWLNLESRGFQAVALHAFRNCSVSSMGLDVADLNRDGYDDVFVTDMVSRQHAWRQRQRPEMMKGIVRQPVEDPNARPEVARNTLQLSRGDGTYAEIAQLAGLDFTEWSWGAVFLDVDLDGFEDVLIPTGNHHDVQDADVLRAQSRLRQLDTLENRVENWRQFPRLATPLLSYRNRRDLTFEETTFEWGFGEPGPWQGLALADLDNDGDLDLAVNRLNGNAALYRNESAQPRLAVRLRGQAPNTHGIGARIRIDGGPVPQSQEMICGGRYLAGDEAVRVFAAGTLASRLKIEVIWRSGRRSVLAKAEPNRFYEIFEPSSEPAPPPPPPAPPAPWFEDVSARLNHRHVDAERDDFATQPLLSRKLSDGGPGVAWADLDEDGWEDLVVGGGTGGQVAVLGNDGRGGFRVWTNAVLARVLTADMSGVLAGRTGTGVPWLLAGRLELQDPAQAASGVEILDLAQGSAIPWPTEPGTAVGPLAVADVDGDGVLDLFAGGRYRTGRYPEPPRSLLRFGVVAANGAEWWREADGRRLVWEELGMVSGAVFSDLTGDGAPELVLACEWGPVRVLRNEQGRLSAWSPPMVWGAAPPAGVATVTRLDELKGWWNGVAAGDFDADGRMDLVVSNWGRNTRFQRHLEQPLRLHYGDLLEDDGLHWVEAWYEPTRREWVPWRDYETLLKVFPFLAETVPTFRAYGEASLEVLMGDRLKSARVLEARTLDLLVLLNRSDHFEARPLPVEAQLAPAFGIVVADFDGDGCEDLFLSQNYLGVEPETSRYDAGTGLCLRGDGRGGFRALSPRESGIWIPGAQRGAGVADFDADGRPDLAVAQYRGETRLLRNAAGRPGLRVRLRGSLTNPSGLGARLRLYGDGGAGPLREVRAGSGYWSQDCAVLVMTAPGRAQEFEVRWPTGEGGRWGMPAGIAEIEVSPSGGWRRIR